MKDDEDISQLHIYRLLIEVKTTLDLTLKQIDEDRAEDVRDKEEIFNRLGTLEKRMAQVVIIAVVISMALPIGINVATRLSMQGTTVERTQ